MTAQEIKKNMTQGEWEVGALGEDTIYSNAKEDQCLGTMDCDYGTFENDKANVLAIVTAVNNTYGKGIDPAIVPELVAFVTNISKMHLDGNPIGHIQIAKRLLVKCEIQ